MPSFSAKASSGILAEALAKAASRREHSPGLSGDSTAASDSDNDELEPLPEPAPSDCRSVMPKVAHMPWEQVGRRTANVMRRAIEDELSEDIGDLRQQAAKDSAESWREVSRRVALALERCAEEADDDDEWP